MSAAWGLLLAVACISDDGLEEVRALLRRGLLREAEQALAPLTDESDPLRRGRVLLLLGNVDFERGLYVRALERYAEAERAGADDPSLAQAARANHARAEERLERRRHLARLEARLRAGLAGAVLVAGFAVAWLARRPRYGSAPPLTTPTP